MTTSFGAQPLQRRMGAGYYTDEELRQFEWGALGVDVRIKRNVVIPFTQNVYIGSHVRIDDFTVIVASSADSPVRLGNHVFVGDLCHLAGSDGITLEDFSAVAPGCHLFSGSDDYTGQKLTGPTLPKELLGGPAGRVTLHRFVILGAGTVVHPGVEIGEGVAVGSLGLVRTDLEAWGIYAGSPVRRLRDRSRAMLDLLPQVTGSDARGSL